MANTISRWNIGPKEVSLNKEEHLLRFSIKTGSHSTQAPVSLQYYDTPYALNLVQMFYNAIETLLTRDAHMISQHSFFPLFCSKDVWILKDGQYTPAQHIYIALFGKPAFGTGSTGAAWGVFHENTQMSDLFDLSPEDGTTRAFVQEIPANNAAPNYKMTSHIQRHRIALLCDPLGTIQTIFLEKKGQFNPNIILSKQNWAITLVSADAALFTQHCTTGHAAVVYEGLDDNGRPFVECAHITTHPPDGGPNLPEDHARIETRDLFHHEHIHGPTWLRPRDLVEKMMVEIRKAEKDRAYVRFSPLKDIKAGAVATVRTGTYIGSVVWLISGIVQAVAPAASIPLMLLRGAVAYAARGLVVAVGAGVAALAEGELARANAATVHCKEWVLRQIANARIRLDLPMTVFTPDGMIEYLNKNPSSAIFY